MKSKFAVLICFLPVVLSSQGCALLKPANSPASPTPAPPTSAAPQVAPKPVQAASDESAVLLVSKIERPDIQELDRVSVQLENADVSFSVDPTLRKKRGVLRVELLNGDEDCKFQFTETDGVIEITEPKGKPAARTAPRTTMNKMSAVGKNKSAVPPLTSNCKFGIEATLPEAAELAVSLKRGSVLVENWDEPIQVKLDWGDIDVGSVGPLNVACGRCNLSGDGISGPLRYEVETGNVGLDGLVGSVSGQTLGDTVLRWKKITSSSNVKLFSKAGDVILSFPGGIPIDINLKAPHGDINSKFEPGEKGVPVSVTAELGNVKVFRSAK